MKNQKKNLPIIEILLIEDNPGDVDLVQEMLGEARDTKFELNYTDRLSTGLKLLVEKNFDLLLLDLSLPDSRGFETFEKAHTHIPAMPIVVLTGLDDEALAIKALQEGAQDYLVKGQIDSNLLIRAVRYAIERKRVEEALRKAHDELETRVLERTRELAKANEALKTEITERKQAEEALRESEGRYRTLLEYTYDLIAEASVDGRFLYASPKHRDVLHYEPDELTGKSIFEYIHPDDYHSVIREFQRAITTFSSGHVIFRFRRKDGEWLWLESTGKPFKTANGEVRAFIATRNITERKQAEEALRESEERYRIVAETASDAIITISEDSTILFVNKAAERIFGYTTQKMVGQQLTMLMPEYLRDVHRGAVKQYIDTGKRHTSWECMELTGLHKNGKEIPLEISFSEFVKNDRHIFIGIVRDITERKLIEHALSKERERLSATLRNISEGVILIDTNDRIVLANPMGQEYLKLLSDVSIGNILTRLGGRPLRKLLEPPLEEKDYHELTLEGLPQRIFEATSQPIVTDSTVTGWVLVVREVTKERADRQHVEAQERLASLGQLAAGIAHNFNTHLTVIIGFSELIKRSDTLTEEDKRRLDLITQQGHQSCQLVRQILDFSRQSMSKRYPLDLVPFLKESAKLLENMIPETIHIVLELAPGEYRVLADPDQLRQIITNIVLNALDAMPAGGELKIRFAGVHFNNRMQPPFPEMPKGDWLTVSVSDTGTGIELEHMPHIFEPFFTTKERSAGGGLGLAQVYGLVKQHGGFIDVSSEPGKGTAFIIYLPPMLREAIVVPELLEEEDLVHGHGETILLVGDNKTMLETNKAMLESLGYRLLTAEDGHKALKLFDRHRGEISVILTDLAMPEMNGVELMQKLNVHNLDIKVILMTSYPLGEEMRKLLSRGVIDWVRKPVNFVKLSQVIGRALRGKSH